jgi:hypothetical protein
MNAFGQAITGLVASGRRLWPSACLAGLRYGSAFLGLPLCSSVCFFGLRFILTTLGVSV